MYREKTSRLLTSKTEDLPLSLVAVIYSRTTEMTAVSLRLVHTGCVALGFGAVRRRAAPHGTARRRTTMQRKASRDRVMCDINGHAILRIG